MGRRQGRRLAGRSETGGGPGGAETGGKQGQQKNKKICWQPHRDTHGLNCREEHSVEVHALFGPRKKRDKRNPAWGASLEGRRVDCVCGQGRGVGVGDEKGGNFLAATDFQNTPMSRTNMVAPCALRNAQSRGAARWKERGEGNKRIFCAYVGWRVADTTTQNVKQRRRSTTGRLLYLVVHSSHDQADFLPMQPMV